MQYSNELREAVLKRLLPPNSESFSRVAAEEGISEQTLRNWFNKAKTQGLSQNNGNNTTFIATAIQAKYITLQTGIEYPYPKGYDSSSIIIPVEINPDLPMQDEAIVSEVYSIEKTNIGWLPHIQAIYSEIERNLGDDGGEQTVTAESYSGTIKCVIIKAIPTD